MTQDLVKELRPLIYNFERYLSAKDLAGFIPDASLREKLMDEGYIRDQMYNGESCFRFTNRAANDLTDDILNNPKEAAVYWWDLVCLKTAKRVDIMNFMFSVFHTHNLLKTISKGRFDFAQTLWEYMATDEEVC